MAMHKISRFVLLALILLAVAVALLCVFKPVAAFDWFGQGGGLSK